MEYPKMNAYWKDWWLLALRGGNYKQCRRVLRNDDDECCCFGVLADGIAPETWDRVGCGYGGRRWVVGKTEGELSGVRLPPSLQATAGVRLDVLLTLEKKNDTGWTFAQIADWIEENL